MNYPVGYAERARDRWKRLRRRPSERLQSLVRSLLAAPHSRPNGAFRAVAGALAREGFRGRINSHSLSRTIPTTLPATKGYVRPTQTAANESAEWLRFNHPRRGLVYPERLRIEHPIEFDLILPGPATIPLARMLEGYSKLVPAFHDLVSISYLWCHSLGMREISPTCLAMLFVSFLQVRRASIFPLFSPEFNSQESAGVPGIVFPTSYIRDYAAKQYHLSMTGGRWAVHEVFLGNHQWTDEIVALETEFMIPIPISTNHTDSDKFRLLRDFMKFVSRISARARRMANCRRSVSSIVPPNIPMHLSSLSALGGGSREIRCRIWGQQSNRSLNYSGSRPIARML